jgi:hypothetical protein
MFEDAQLKSALRDRDEAGDWFVAFRDHHLFARQGRLNQPEELRPCDVNDNLPRDSRSSDSRLANLANLADARPSSACHAHCLSGAKRANFLA